MSTTPPLNPGEYRPLAGPDNTHTLEVILRNPDEQPVTEGTSTIPQEASKSESSTNLPAPSEVPPTPNVVSEGAQFAERLALPAETPALTGAASEFITTLSERVKALTSHGAEIVESTRKALHPRAIPTVIDGKVNFSALRDGADLEDVLNRLGPETVSNSKPTTMEQVHAAYDQYGYSETRARGYADTRLPVERDLLGIAEFVKQAKDEFLTVTDAARNGDLDAKRSLLHRFNVLSEAGRQMYGVRSELGRGMYMLQDVQGELRFMRELQGRLKTQGVDTGMTIDDLMSATEGMDPATLTQFAVNATDPSVGGALREYWKNAIVSGTKTAMANALGSLSSTVFDIPEKFLAGAFNSMFDLGGNASVHDALEKAAGLYHGFYAALGVGMESLRRGESLVSQMKWEKGFTPELRPEAFGITDQTSMLYWTAQRAMTLARTPFRILTATDDFFKTWNVQSELYVLANTEARTTGRPFAEVIANPTPEMMQEAIHRSDVLTFANSLSDPNAAFGNIRSMAAGIQGVTIHHPAWQWMFPFMTAPTNLFTYALERTPGLNLLASKMVSDVMAGGDRGAIALSKYGMSAMFGMTAVGLAASGNLTAGAPKDPQLAAVWKSDHPEYSIKIGDRWLSYKNTDPLGLMLSAYATVGQAMREGGVGPQVLPGIILGFMDLTAEKSMFRTIGTVYNAARGDTFSQDKLLGAGKIALDLFEGFIPNVARDAERAFNPNRKDIDTLLEYIQARTPGFGGAVANDYNIYGEKVLYSYGYDSTTIDPFVRFLSPGSLQKYQPDTVALEVARLHQIDPSYGVEMHSRKIDGVDLDAPTRDRYQEYIAQPDPRMKTLREATNDMVASSLYRSFNNAPSIQDSLIKHVFSHYRAMARARIVSENTDILGKAQERTLKGYGIQR